MKVAAISDMSKQPIEKPHEMVRVDFTFSRMGKDVTFTADVNTSESEQMQGEIVKIFPWMKHEEIATR